MRYGQIAGKTFIKATIDCCFKYLQPEDADAFEKKFREQAHDQVMHTLRELVLGAFLASKGFKVRYDQSVLGKTPDWVLYGESAGPSCFVELVNFHTDKATEDKIEKHFRANRTWCDFVPSNEERLYDRIRKKAATYKGIVKEAHVAYVVALFGERDADVENKELRQCLFNEAMGLFSLYQQMSGLLFFAGHGNYTFTYFANPHAERRVDLPSGMF